MGFFRRDKLISGWAKFYDKIASEQSDSNIDFDELVAYLERLG